MGTIFFKTEKVTDRITRIFGIAGELMYLVEGSKEAVLIDTGVGIGDLRDFVDTMTDKKLSVLLSHGHVDHALGAGTFDRVYMNFRDMDVYQENARKSHRMAFLDSEAAGWRTCVNEKTFIDKPVKHFLPLEDGQSFDLGGLTIEAFSLAGHTPGSMVFLFLEERSLLFGDACNSFTFLYDHNSSYVSEYRRNLLRLQEKVKGRYERSYVSHGTGEVAVGLLESAISLTADILDGNTDDMPFEFMGERAYAAKRTDKELKRLDGGVANIVYSKDKVIAL